MAWQTIVTEDGVVDEAGPTLSSWVSQKPKELHRVLVERTDAGTNIWYVQVWASLDGTNTTTVANEEIAFAGTTTLAEIGVFGMRYFAIGVRSEGDSVTADVDVVADDGLNV